MTKKYSQAELKAHIDSLPYDELGEVKNGKMIARGWNNFMAEMKRRGRPRKVAKKEVVNIAFEQDDLTYLRSSGRGWQTRVREYVEKGISSGAL